MKKLIPPLTFESYKGQHNKICVIGGSLEYTGAPFYAAMSASHMGVDLCHVFCAQAAGAPLKAYSPVLIVHPILDAVDPRELLDWLPRFDAVVVGPGLGRDPHVQATARRLIAHSLEHCPRQRLVLDGDAFQLLYREPDLVRGHRRVVLTPNKKEFESLCDALGVDPLASLAEVCRSLGGVTVLKKALIDVVSDGETEIALHDAPRGCPKRCGGQGDVLAGVLGALLAWNEEELVPACCAAAEIVKTVAERAYKKKRRAMNPTHLLEELENFVAKMD